MNREEAVKWLKALNTSPLIYGEHSEAIDMAINALAVWPQYKWERDVAISQLEEYGIGFAEKKRDMVKVVRCGECKHMIADGRCMEFADDGIRPSATDFCSYGKRREDGEA